MESGVLKGEVCNRDGCVGVINEHEKEGGCSCHINPPCGYCESDTSFCPLCEWNGKDERHEYENAIYEQSKNNGSYEMYNRMMDERDKWKKQFQAKMKGELPVDKIEYQILTHTHFTQICEGVYPIGTKREEVLQKVRGTFGGRFTKFDNGVFEYVAYTD